MRRLRHIALVWLLLAPASLPASADEAIVADISNYRVAITTGFAGTEMLLFGAVDGDGDVVVLVRGPSRPVVVHRKSRILGIWANAASMTFDRAPSFYRIATSGPLDEIATPEVQERNQMGLAHLDLPLPRAKASENIAQRWRDALIRNHQRQGLYASEILPVTFLGARLFKVRMGLPANVPTGPYLVYVYLLRDGEVISGQITPLQVSKVGLEAAIFDFAYEHAAFYGLIAILVAIVAGWLGNVAFRRA
jgi:uncharacterized protein (TIGR02186 family)